MRIMYFTAASRGSRKILSLGVETTALVSTHGRSSRPGTLPRTEKNP